MNQDVVLRLELIAAKAKMLAQDLKNGRLWEGELSAGISDLMSQLNSAMQDARTDR